MRSELTEMQAKVMHLMSQDGSTSKEIGRILGVSYKTIDAHAEVAIRKLGARNRTHAALMWDRLQRERARINEALAAKLGVA